MSKTLWIVSGGIEAISGIRLAKEMGLHVVVSDRNPKAPGFAFADDRVLADTYDINATVEAARKYSRAVRPVDGVMCIASDVPLTVASTAAALGLPGIPVASALLAADKLEMKRKFEQDGVPIPWFSPVESGAHLREIVRRRGFPLVLKPVDSRGARGVLLLRAGTDLDWAYGLSHHHSPTGRVMVEEFLPGPQVSTESIVLDGIAYTPGFADRNYEYLDRYAPHIIENGGDLPSRLPESTQEEIRSLVQKAARSMGIGNGVVKGDMVVSDGKAYVIELAARLSGGYFCTHEIPLNTGVDFVGQAIRLALGERLDPLALTPRFQKGVAQRYLFPEPGRVVRITGEEDVARRPGIVHCEIRVAVGDVIGPMDSHPARPGVVIATGDTREVAINRAVAAVKDICIETEAIAS
jgi:biotin carboxylase